MSDVGVVFLVVGDNEGGVEDGQRAFILYGLGVVMRNVCHHFRHESRRSVDYSLIDMLYYLLHGLVTGI